jgi:hypothetical protein
MRTERPAHQASSWHSPHPHAPAYYVRGSLAASAVPRLALTDKSSRSCVRLSFQGNCGLQSAAQPQRGCSVWPRVGRRRRTTLGQHDKYKSSNPNGVASRAPRLGCNPVGVEQPDFLFFTQGSPPAASNPGLEASTPVGVALQQRIVAEQKRLLSQEALSSHKRRSCTA